MPEGRKPQPDYLSVTEGDAGPDPIEREAYPPPKELDEHAATYWRAWVDDAVEMGIINKFDMPSFQRLCELAGACDRFYEAYKQEEPVQPGRKDGERKKSPAWTQYKQAAKEFRMWASEMGMTPTGRQKLDLGDSGDTDPMEEAFG